MKNKRDWLKYLMEDWVIPLGLGAAIIGGVIGLIRMAMQVSFVG